MPNRTSEKVGEGQLTFRDRESRKVAYELDPANAGGRIKGATRQFVTQRNAQLEDEEGVIWDIEGPAAPMTDNDDWVEVTVRKGESWR